MRSKKSHVIGLVALVVSFAVQAPADDEQSSQQERELIAVLQSDAPAAEKAITCKHLAVHGTSAAVPELANLLSDERFASWARIALEAIPGTEADEALRSAAESLDGKLLVGVINSIGVRRDEGALEPLSGRLQDGDAQVASAAAAALGRIGTPAAADSLRQALATVPVDVRSAVAEGCVLCAERFLEEDNTEVAIEIYDEVRNADVPRPRILEATRGAILARKQDGIPLLLEQLNSPDKDLFQLALGTAREIPGNKLDEALAAELPRAEPLRGALIVHAMADRPETVVLPAVVDAAKGGPKPVRIAAISALGRVGNEPCLTSLLEIATEDDADVAQTAKAALVELPGNNVDSGIVGLIPDAEEDAYLVLIELIGQRRINALEPLLDAVDRPDPAVRSAALASLGRTVPADALSVLITRVVAPPFAEDAPLAQQALKVAAVRMPDREACATELTMALQEASIPSKTALLETLGAVGGAQALKTIGAAARSDDDPLRDVGSRLLGEWMTIDAAPVLLDLATSGPADKYQIRAIRGYIRIARQFTMPDEERVEMCRKALNASRRSDEHKLVLQVLERYPTLGMLKLAAEVMQFPELKEDSTRAALVIAQKLDKKEQEQVQEILAGAGLKSVKLEIVKAEYGAGSNRKDVTAILQKHAGELPLIVLPQSSYNASFGGDPAPQVPKRLTVKYQINGVEGEASFAENATIVLPLPESEKPSR